MKVYLLIWNGVECGINIEGIYSTREIAEQFCQMLISKYDQPEWSLADDIYVQEQDVNVWPLKLNESQQNLAGRPKVV